MKVKLILSGILFHTLITTGFSQFNPDWSNSYQHTSSLNYSNESRKVITDHFGNVFVLGDVTSDLDVSGNVSGSTEHYCALLKYDSTGFLLDQQIIETESHLISGFNNISAFGLGIDLADNIYVGFSYYELSNSFDIHIKKYSNNLIPIWTSIFKPGTSDIGIDMKVSPSGTVTALIESSSGGNTTYHLFSTNSGTVSATPLYSFIANRDVLNRIIVDNSGDIYTTGYSLFGVNKSILTASVTSGGILRWVINYNAGSVLRDDYGTDLMLDGSGNLYVTGTSDQGVPTYNDVLVMKHLAATGKVFYITYDDNSGADDHGMFIDVSLTGAAYIAVESGTNLFIDRMDKNSGVVMGKASHHPLPINPYNNINQITITDFKVTTNSTFYVTGEVLATETGGLNFTAAYLTRFDLVPAGRGNLAIHLSLDHPVEGTANESLLSTALALDVQREKIMWLKSSYNTFANHQREAIVLTQLGVPNALRSEINDPKIESGLNIFPNPASDIIYLSASEVITEAKIYDVNGKIVTEFHLNALTQFINISELPKGIYMISYVLESGTQGYCKLLKQ